MTESRDGLNWERESRIIEGPEGRDFRDPKVFYENGEYKMLIGIRGEEHPAISLYKSYNLAQWTYCGEIFEEQKEEENIPLECPDLFRLDNQWVLTAGYCGHVDGHGRKTASITTSENGIRISSMRRPEGFMILAQISMRCRPSIRRPDGWLSAGSATWQRSTSNRQTVRAEV